MPYATQAAFAELYVVDAVDAGIDDDVLDLENPPPSRGAELPCAAALEFMADVHEAKGKEGVPEAVKVCHILTQTDVCCHTVACHFWSVLELARSHARSYTEKVRCHIAAHRPLIKACHEDRYWEFRMRDAIANAGTA
jgi:hypothetical protein